MSLRELALKHLEQVSGAGCPASGHIGMSGPDKTTESLISLRVQPVRSPDAIRTNTSGSDSLFDADRARRPDKPDGSDNSDMSDRSVSWKLQREADRRNAQALRTGITDRWCACGGLARLAWLEGARREVWRCD
jgi:hypothetical protein